MTDYQSSINILVTLTVSFTDGNESMYRISFTQTLNIPPTVIRSDVFNHMMDQATEFAGKALEPKGVDVSGLSRMVEFFDLAPERIPADWFRQ